MATYKIGPGITTVKRQFTDAEVKNMNSVPLSIVAAPGAGFSAVLVSLNVVLDAAAGAYAGVTYPTITDGAQSGVAILTNLTSATVQKIYGIATDEDANLAVAGGKALTDNTGISITGSGNPTGGNAANTYSVECVYKIMRTVAFT